MDNIKTPLHYHITVVSAQVSVPPVVSNNRIDALDVYGKTVKLVEDLTGLPASGWKSGTATFLDGSTVRIFHCSRPCVDD